MNPKSVFIVKTPGASTSTLSQLSRIKETIPNVKLILVVRNPIDRMISEVVHEFTNPNTRFQGEDMPDINKIFLGQTSLKSEDGHPYHSTLVLKSNFSHLIRVIYITISNFTSVRPSVHLSRPSTLQNLAIVYKISLKKAV